jgi:hypothetical protein
LVFYDPRPFHGLHWWRKRRLRAAVLLAALVPGVLFAFWAAWADRHRATVS